MCITAYTAHIWKKMGTTPQIWVVGGKKALCGLWINEGEEEWDDNAAASGPKQTSYKSGRP